MLKPLNPRNTENLGDNYESYRWFFTTNNVLVVGGKSDDQNEIVLKNFLKPEFTVMHTKKPGSPFMILQTEKPTKTDLNEAAVFCACFSKEWKKSNSKSQIEIDIFKGNQIHKNRLMKLGTFGVAGKKETVKVKPKLVLVIQKGRLRAVPKNGKEELIATVTPGKLSKEDAAEKIFRKIKDKYHFPITKEEIMSAIPSDKLSVR